MKITQEDIDSITDDLYAAHVNYSTDIDTWNEIQNKEATLDFLWEMYQELTENKGD